MRSEAEGLSANKLPCDLGICTDPECRREHVEIEVVYVGNCLICNQPVDEQDAVMTKGTLFHEECAERLLPYDPNFDPGIPKPGM